MLGLLGALDPYKHKQHRRSGQRSKMGTPISKPMDKKFRQQQNTGELAVWSGWGGGGGGSVVFVIYHFAPLDKSMPLDLKCTVIITL